MTQVNTTKSNTNKSSLQSFYGNSFIYEIYPDNWKASWGPKPLLGFVKADSEYYARYAAFDKGLMPPNATFEPQAVKVLEYKSKTNTTYRKTRQ